MDDQFRNRFRRYDDRAPLRPRPDAVPPRPVAAPPVSPSPPPPMPAAMSNKQSISPAHRGQSAGRTASRREAIPPRQEFVRPRPHAIPHHNSAQNLSPPAVALSPAPPRKHGKGSKKRLLAATLISVVILGVLSSFWFVVKPRMHSKSSNTTNKTVSNQQTTQKPVGKLIRLVAVGDTIAYSSINQAAQVGGSYNYTPLMSALKPIMMKSDIRICSQTVPAAGNVAGPISGPPTFNAPPQLAKGLEDIGCNTFDMASPNTNDKGQAAIDASLANYYNNPNILAVAGANRSDAEQKSISYFTVKGLKIAYLSYTVSSNVANPTPYGVNIYSDALADSQITEARKNATLVVVSMHWGSDQADNENSAQDSIAQHLANDNADIIIGNGPHVIEPVKVLSGSSGHQSLVWFSLGNFLHSQVPVNSVIGGMAIMDIDSVSGQVHNPRLLPLYMHYEWTADQKLHQTDADLLARRNFKVVPLDQAADLLAKSQNNTTVSAQQDRVRAIVNKYFTIPLTTTNNL